jgi:hypothetical protein
MITKSRHLLANEKLDDWAKPRVICGLTIFVTKYDNNRWIEHF